MDTEVQGDMTKYRCHIIVHALKIKAVEFDVDRAYVEERETDGTATIFPEEEGFNLFKVDAEYVRKHLLGKKASEIIGGYYVVNEDGYRSWSPAKAFENGYTKVN